MSGDAHPYLRVRYPSQGEWASMTRPPFRAFRAFRGENSPSSSSLCALCALCG